MRFFNIGKFAFLFVVMMLFFQNLHAQLTFEYTTECSTTVFDEFALFGTVSGGSGSYGYIFGGELTNVSADPNDPTIGYIYFPDLKSDQPDPYILIIYDLNSNEEITEYISVSCVKAGLELTQQEIFCTGNTFTYTGLVTLGSGNYVYSLDGSEFETIPTINDTTSLLTLEMLESGEEVLHIVTISDLTTGHTLTDTLSMLCEDNWAVELLNFTGTKTTDGFTLNWSTVQEQNVNYFLLQTSTDGVNFTTIDTIAATGNSNIPQNYFLHYTTEACSQYFQVVAVGGGSNEVQIISNQLLLNDCSEEISVSLGATLVREQIIVSYQNVKDLTIYLYDVCGRLVRIYDNIADGTATLNLTEKDLPPSMYIVHFKWANGNKTEKILLNP
ncbi:MAG: T9SS type A sorting domain-containing protein [Chitinophagales bacterium]|nr:T9SS type A sorting domain-containing protein [Chitinophagales bacterium]